MSNKSGVARQLNPSEVIKSPASRLTIRRLAMAGGLLLGAEAPRRTMTSVGLSWGDRVFDFLHAVCGCRPRIASLHPQNASSLYPEYCYLIFINCAYLFDCFMRKLAAHVARVAYDLGGTSEPLLHGRCGLRYGLSLTSSRQHMPEHGPYLRPHLP